MSYREDPDLQFLSSLTAKDLQLLHNYIVFDKDGKRRHGEQLTKKDVYKQFYPHHHKYWQDIAEEYQMYGGNTFANKVRGYGVPHREILSDVCDFLKIKKHKHLSAEEAEEKLLLKVFAQAVEKMNENDRNDLAREMGLHPMDLSGPAIAFAAQMVIRQGGFAAYQTIIILANSAAKALGFAIPFAANAAITKCVAILAGPIAWVFTALWTAVEVGGPAYRVTVPCAIQIAFLRNSRLNGRAGNFFTRLGFRIRGAFMRLFMGGNKILPLSSNKAINK